MAQDEIRDLLGKSFMPKAPPPESEWVGGSVQPKTPPPPTDALPPPPPSDNR